MERRPVFEPRGVRHCSPTRFVTASDTKPPTDPGTMSGFSGGEFTPCSDPACHRRDWDRGRGGGRGATATCPRAVASRYLYRVGVVSGQGGRTGASPASLQFPSFQRGALEKSAWIRAGALRVDWTGGGPTGRQPWPRMKLVRKPEKLSDVANLPPCRMHVQRSFNCIRWS